MLLAPNLDQRLVTSERLTVTDVDLPGAQLRAVTTEGRPVVLAGEAIDADHLDHGYALTVHRAQGATYDRAHVLAAGGGREPAYVALSRARTGTTLHTVADDLDQARHDLGIDWSNDQHQRWITDTTGRTTGPTPAEIVGVQRPEQRRVEAHRRLVTLENDLRDIYAGGGRWERTPGGLNARTRNEVRIRLEDVQRRAVHPSTGRRGRRSALREADALGPVLEAAEARWQAVGQPAADRVRHSIAGVEAEIERNDLGERRRYLASLLDQRMPRATPVAHEIPQPHRSPGHEGLGL